MICLDKLRHAYMLAALNMREVQSKQPKHKYDDVPNHHLDDIVMIKNFDRKSTWDVKYISQLQSSALDRDKTNESIRSQG